MIGKPWVYSIVYADPDQTFAVQATSIENAIAAANAHRKLNRLNNKVLRAVAFADVDYVIDATVP